VKNKKFEHSFVKEGVRVIESAFNEDFSNGKVQIIQEGFNVSKSRFYTKEAIQNDIKNFEGVKMFVNHEDDRETAKRGARDVKDWVATIKTTESAVDSDGKISGFGDIVVHAQWFKDLLKQTKESGVLSGMGASINAFCAGSRKQVGNKFTNVIEGFPKPLSVDFVASAGAGGKVISFKESYYEGDEDMDLSKITLEELKESAPELYAKAAESGKELAKKEIEDEKAKEAAAAKKAEEAKKAKESGNDKEDVDAKFNVREARMDRKELVSSIVSESNLPASAKERVKESILAQEVTLKDEKLDIKETKEAIATAIESEEKYIKEFREAQITGNGSEDSEENKPELFIEGLGAALDSAVGIEKTKETGGEK